MKFARRVVCRRMDAHEWMADEVKINDGKDASHISSNGLLLTSTSLPSDGLQPARHLSDPLHPST